MSYSLRRRPLAPLPLSYFSASPSASTSTLPLSLPNTYPAPPSPLSLPLKRSPSTTSLGAPPRKVSRGSKDADVRRTEEEIGADRVRRSGSGGVTPRVKKVLERDDLGTGKSPARRLFGAASERPISGISGAVVTPPSETHTRTYSPRRLLAPSPPIDDPQSYFTDVQVGDTEHENGAEVDVHDPGFVVHHDDAGSSSSSAVVSRPLTPRSRSTPVIAVSVPLSPAPVSPLSPLELENQENIPPPSYSHTIAHPPSPKHKHAFHNSPSKYSTSDADMYLFVPSTSASSSTLTLSGGSGSGSGGTRRRERSKLVNEVLLLRGEVEIKRASTPGAGAASEVREMRVEREEQEAQGEELTPGRVTRSAKGKAREALVREVEGA